MLIQSAIQAYGKRLTHAIVYVEVIPL